MGAAITSSSVSVLPVAGLGAQASSAGRSFSRPLLSGDRGTAQTINLIRKAVADGLTDPRVNQLAASIVRAVPEYDDRAAAEAIFNWPLGNVRFTNDPCGSEMIRSANWTIENGIGDCDDINGVLLPTLLMTVGIPARLVTVANDPYHPNDFTHIYCEAQIDGAWIPLDAARPGATFGTTSQGIYRKRIWSLMDSGYADVGLSGVRALGCECDRYQAGMGDDGDSTLSTIFKGIANVATGITGDIAAASGSPVIYASAPATGANYGVSSGLGGMSMTTILLLVIGGAVAIAAVKK